MIEHDITVYGNDPYGAENLLSMSSYVKYIDRYKNNDKNFLELGIGHSKTISLLVKLFKNLTVIDAELEFINKYKNQYNNINFEHSFFEDYEPNGQTFNNIGMGFILEHVNDPNVILKKFVNLLDKNGRIFVSVPNASSLHRLLALKAGLLEDIHALSETDKRYGHVRFHSYNDWVELFTTCGLKVIASHGLFLKPFTTQQINQLNLDNKVYEALATMGEDYPEISNSCFFVLTKDSELH